MLAKPCNFKIRSLYLLPVQVSPSHKNLIPSEEQSLWQPIVSKNTWNNHLSFHAFEVDLPISNSDPFFPWRPYSEKEHIPYVYIVDPYLLDFCLRFLPGRQPAFAKNNSFQWPIYSTRSPSSESVSIWFSEWERNDGTDHGPSRVYVLSN